VRVTRIGSVALIEVLNERDGARSGLVVGSISLSLAPGASSAADA
jgi:hypothetical protein